MLFIGKKNLLEVKMKDALLPRNIDDCAKLFSILWQSLFGEIAIDTFNKQQCMGFLTMINLTKLMYCMDIFKCLHYIQHCFKHWVFESKIGTSSPIIEASFWVRKVTDNSNIIIQYQMVICHRKSGVKLEGNI